MSSLVLKRIYGDERFSLRLQIALRSPLFQKNQDTQFAGSLRYLRTILEPFLPSLYLHVSYVRWNVDDFEQFLQIHSHVRWSEKVECLLLVFLSLFSEFFVHKVFIITVKMVFNSFNTVSSVQMFMTSFTHRMCNIPSRSTRFSVIAVTVSNFSLSSNVRDVFLFHIYFSLAYLHYISLQYQLDPRQNSLLVAYTDHSKLAKEQLLHFVCFISN